MWLELSEKQIFKSKFQSRQLTRSRQYFTLNGVTLHKQLAKENHPYPRRQKLAVKLDRSEPSSRLKKGKFYLHVHQIKIYNPEIGTRWLGTGRLIKKLMSTFGAKYHPRKKASNNTQYQTTVNTINRVNHNYQKYSSQMPVFLNHQKQHPYPKFSTRPVLIQQQPQIASNINQPIRNTEQNCSFFRVPVQQGMG